MRPGVHGNADLQLRVTAKLHVLLPRVVSREARLAVARITGGGGPAGGFPSNGETLQQPAVEAHVELLRPAHALEVILILPLETDFQEVLAVNREVVTDRDSAARPERKILALPIVLHHEQGNFEGLDPGAHRRQADRQP
jgi:hypothetical protein